VLSLSTSRAHLLIAPGSTAENIAVFIWEAMAAELGSAASLLYKVRVQETEKNSAVYKGECVPC
jgi:6-pyruvoyl-tetrahydropterin synthase